jgi:transcriptional regulator with XRE-family HTH domain
MQTNNEPSAAARRISRMSPDRAARLRRWGESLQDRITKKNLNQSEFASRVALFTRDKRMGRDLISNYIRGVSEPTPLKQTAMASALGITVDELMAPMSVIPARSMESPIEMKSVSPTRARLRIDTELPYGVVVQILGLINSEGK